MRIDSNLKVLFQSAAAAVAMVTGVNPMFGVQSAGFVFDSAKAKLSK